MSLGFGKMLDRKTIKCSIARALSLVAVDRGLLALQKRVLRGRFIRAINYHGTPRSDERNFERHLQLYRSHFSAVHAADLEAFLSNGTWEKDKPGLIISFDDGLRTNYDVAAPLLEQYGFVGWFFVPTDFIDTPSHEQKRFAETHAIHNRDGDYQDGRIALSWDELQELDRTHDIGCHTKSHWRMTPSASEQRLNEEIIQSKHVLEQKLGHDMDTFCWVGGEEHSYNAAGYARIVSAGYKYGFMTCSSPVVAGTNPFQLHRTNVETDWPIPLLRFQICGIADWFNNGKRKRVGRIVTGNGRTI